LGGSGFVDTRVCLLSGGIMYTMLYVAAIAQKTGPAMIGLTSVAGDRIGSFPPLSVARALG
jgi:hypothetical protein